MEIQLKISGWLLVGLSLIHLSFPKYFDWKNELSALTLINRQMMWVHTLFIGLSVLLMGLLCISSADELIETILGRRLALGFSIFWGMRLFIQFFGYSSELWKGKLFETSVHILFSIFWGYLTALFFAVYWT